MNSVARSIILRVCVVIPRVKEIAAIMQISLRVSHYTDVEHIRWRQRRVTKLKLVCDGRATLVARLRIATDW